MARTQQEAKEALRKIKIAYEDAKGDAKMKSLLSKFEAKIKTLEDEVKSFESGDKTSTKKKVSAKELEVAKVQLEEGQSQRQAKKTVSKRRAGKPKPKAERSSSKTVPIENAKKPEHKRGDILRSTKIKTFRAKGGSEELSMRYIDATNGYGVYLGDEVAYHNTDGDAVNKRYDEFVKGTSTSTKSKSKTTDVDVPEKEINEKDCQDEIQRYIQRQEAKEKRTRKKSATKSARKSVSSDLSNRSVTYLKSVVKYQKKEGKVNPKEIEHFAKLLREALKYAKSKFSTFKSMKSIQQFDKEVKGILEELKKSEDK